MERLLFKMMNPLSYECEENNELLSVLIFLMFFLHIPLLSFSLILSSIHYRTFIIPPCPQVVFFSFLLPFPNFLLLSPPQPKHTVQ